MAIGAGLTCIGCGLFYMLEIDTSVGRWVGYQIFTGFFIGMTFQTTLTVVQSTATPEDMSSATAMIFCEFFPVYVTYYIESLLTIERSLSNGRGRFPSFRRSVSLQ